MLEHLQRRVTQYRLATPMRPAGYGGVGTSAAWFAFGSMSRSPLDGALLSDAHGIAFVALPSISPHGARNAAAQGSSATC